MDKFKSGLKKHKTTLIVAITILILFGIFSLSKVNTVKTVSYNEFVKMMEAKKVKGVSIDLKNPTFVFEAPDGKLFKTDNPKSEEFKKLLLEKDLEVTEVSKTSMMSIFNTFISLFILTILFTSLGKMTSMGDKEFSSTKDKKELIPDVKFDDLAGCEDIKQDMIDLVTFLKEPEKYEAMGAKIPKGIMLYGSPGTGKTLTAKAIAGEAGVPFFSVSGSDFVEMYVGVGAKRVRALFEKAKKEAPSIIFIDEIDAVGSKRGMSRNSEQDQTINALLKEMDGFGGKEGVIVIGATNRLDTLDDALIRAGRFDRHVAVSLPNASEREKIFEIHAKNKKMAKEVDFKKLSKQTVGFSGAMISTLLNESAIKAVNNNKTEIDLEDIDSAFTEQILKGKQKNEINKVRTKEEIELIAYHEAGHVLATKMLTDNYISKVTIIENTSGAGGATFSIPKKEGLLSKKDLLNRIRVLYAGRVAESILYNEDDDLVTTGASNDIEVATDVLFHIVNSYGMSPQTGMVKIDRILKDNHFILTEVQELSKKLYNETFELIKENKDKLVLVANELIEKENLDGDEIEALLGISLVKEVA